MHRHAETHLKLEGNQSLSFHSLEPPSSQLPSLKSWVTVGFRGLKSVGVAFARGKKKPMKLQHTGNAPVPGLILEILLLVKPKFRMSIEKREQ